METYVGAPGIMLNLRELSPGSTLLHPEDQTATINALAQGVTAQDPVALKVVRDTARYLGAGISDLVNLLNPEVVVLSSWVAATLGEPLLNEVREAVARHALKRPYAATEIVLSPSRPIRSASEPRRSPWKGRSSRSARGPRSAPPQQGAVPHHLHDDGRDAR